MATELLALKLLDVLASVCATIMADVARAAAAPRGDPDPEGGMSDDELRAAAAGIVAWCSDTPEAVLNEEVLAVARAYLAEHPADDGEPAGFDWLAELAQRHHGDDPEREDVWWEIGPLSFTCDSYQPDPGEPFETVATDWQVEGESLPKLLWPRTRGDVRRLMAAVGCVKE